MDPLLQELDELLKGNQKWRANSQNPADFKDGSDWRQPNAPAFELDKRTPWDFMKDEFSLPPGWRDSGGPASQPRPKMTDMTYKSRKALAPVAYRPGEMSFDEVRAARERTKNPEDQKKLALEDRRAFAREYVRDNPITGIPAMAVLPPLEMAYKGGRAALGMDPGGRSGFFDPMANIGAGWTGMGQGAMDLIDQLLKDL